LFILFLL